jgi:hypothetical protein
VFMMTGPRTNHFITGLPNITLPLVATIGNVPVIGFSLLLGSRMMVLLLPELVKGGSVY